MSKQEIRNAAYHGPFVTAARRVFSNAGDPHVKKWQTYVKGDPRRQEVLETALKWVSRNHIEDYMAEHRNDSDISEMLNYFTSVIGWIGSVFSYTDKEVCGLSWGELYETYHEKPYDKDKVDARVNSLMADPAVRNKKGIFEYILGGETDPRLLQIRVFEESTKRTVYQRQTNEAKAKGVSNCPDCAAEKKGPNRTRIWKLAEMDADHVTAWSNGGPTDISNCQMLCKKHNRSKGNT